jgi:hypothetical protein
MMTYSIRALAAVFALALAAPLVAQQKPITVVGLVDHRQDRQGQSLVEIFAPCSAAANAFGSIGPKSAVKAGSSCRSRA